MPLRPRSPLGAEPFPQFRPSFAPRNIAYSNRDRLPLSDQYDEPLSAGEAGVKKIALKHGVMLGRDRQDDGRIFRALRLMDGGCVGEDQAVEFAALVGDLSAVEIDRDLAGLGIDLGDEAEIAV